MSRPLRRLAALALVGVALVGCGSDDDSAATTTVPSPLIDELLVVLRANTEPTGVPAFDAAQPCLREAFAAYTDAELQTLVTAIGAGDLTSVPADLSQRLRDDGFSCNEENRMVDAADYKEDTEQRIADTGVTSVQCELPTEIAEGATFRCTGNFQNRTSEYLVTIGPIGHVVIERSD